MSHVVGAGVDARLSPRRPSYLKRTRVTSVNYSFPQRQLVLPVTILIGFPPGRDPLGGRKFIGPFSGFSGLLPCDSF